jgi:RNA polymerase sigma-70 factor, ECF subfamily
MDVTVLVSEAKKGNTEAFAGIYDLYAQRIFRYVRMKIQNRSEAEDLLQEVFVRAWRGLPNFDPRAGKFAAWLYRIASNTVNDHFRRVYRSPKTVEFTEGTDVGFEEPAKEALANESEMIEVRRAMSHLPPQYREVLELRFIQEFSVAETAKVMRRSRLAVRLAQVRALKKLRLLLKGKFIK